MQMFIGKLENWMKRRWRENTIGIQLDTLEMWEAFSIICGFKGINWEKSKCSFVWSKEENITGK